MRYSTPFCWNNSNVILDRGVVAAFADQGISEPLLEEWLEIAFPDGSLSHQVLLARAYDNEKGTSIHEDLPTVQDLPDFYNLE